MIESEKRDRRTLTRSPAPKHRVGDINAMPNTENTATKRDVYERVTSQIINAIEQGVSNWRMPWHTSGKFVFSPINVASKKPYRGINTLCLWAKD
jgi:antirestriction protein ArdC